MDVYEIIGGTATSLRMEGEHRIINASSLPDPVPLDNKAIENKGFKAYQTNVVKL